MKTPVPESVEGSDKRFSRRTMAQQSVHRAWQEACHLLNRNVSRVKSSSQSTVPVRDRSWGLLKRMNWR